MNAMDRIKSFVVAQNDTNHGYDLNATAEALTPYPTSVKTALVMERKTPSPSPHCLKTTSLDRQTLCKDSRTSALSSPSTVTAVDTIASEPAQSTESPPVSTPEPINILSSPVKTNSDSSSVIYSLSLISQPDQSHSADLQSQANISQSDHYTTLSNSRQHPAPSVSRERATVGGINTEQSVSHTRDLSDFNDTIELARGHDPGELSLEQPHSALPDLEFSAAESAECGRTTDISTSPSEDRCVVLNADSAQQGHEGLSLGKKRHKELVVDLVSLCHANHRHDCEGRSRNGAGEVTYTKVAEAMLRKDHLLTETKNATTGGTKPHILLIHSTSPTSLQQQHLAAALNSRESSTSCRQALTAVTPRVTSDHFSGLNLVSLAAIGICPHT